MFGAPVCGAMDGLVTNMDGRPALVGFGGARRNGQHHHQRQGERYEQGKAAVHASYIGRLPKICELLSRMISTPPAADLPAAAPSHPRRRLSLA
jgi:hypothetical protein